MNEARASFFRRLVRRVLRYPRIQRRYHLSDAEIDGHIRELEAVADIVDPFEGPLVLRPRDLFR